MYNFLFDLLFVCGINEIDVGVAAVPIAAKREVLVSRHVNRV